MPKKKVLLSTVNLPCRVRTMAQNLGVTSLNDLCRHTADELLDAKNFGQRSLHELEFVLWKNKLELKP